MLNQLLLLLKEQINNDLLGFRIIPGSHKRTIEHYTVSPKTKLPTVVCRSRHFLETLSNIPAMEISKRG